MYAISTNLCKSASTKGFAYGDVKIVAISLLIVLQLFITSALLAALSTA